MSKLPVALQLYTVRDQTSQDFVGTLAKVAEMGYGSVEFAETGGLSATELRALLDDLGLQAVGPHVGLDVLESDLEATLDYFSVVGGI